MTAYYINEEPPVLPGNVIKKYRSSAKLTQEKLAELVGLDTRTIRGYELGEHQLTNVQIARKIAAALRIPSAESGLHEITTAIFEDVERAFDEIWHLVATANFAQAHHNILTALEYLKQEASDLHGSKNLAYAHFLAGHIEAITCPTNRVDQALAHFEAMERYSNDDHTLMNLSLTYQGDMLRRGGNISAAVQLLEKARATTPRSSSSAKGNNQQLLARAYFHKRDTPRFEEAINRSIGFAEDILENGGINDIAGGIRVSFNLHTVYEEHARCHARINNIKESLSSLDKAEAVQLGELRWQMNIKATRGEILIRKAMLPTSMNVRDLVANDDFQHGISLLRETADLAKQTGHHRLLQQIQGVARYLDKKSLYFSQAAGIVRDAVDKGGILD